MSNQQEDYVLDSPYTWGYFHEQSPKQLQLVARINGIEGPDISAPFHYCELGSGNGLTSNLLAAAYPQGEFYAVDFNPEHTRNSEHMCDRGQLTNVRHLNLDFQAFLDSDTPEFDFITLHGVYSWVSKAVREEVVEIVSQKLKPNGLLYLCYNAMPGWAELMPLWHMMMRFADTRSGSTLERAKESLEYLRFLRDKESPYFTHTPYASRHLDKLLSRDPHHLVHDLFNKGFAPCYFSEVAEDFQRADVRYLGDAYIFRNYPSLTLLPQFTPYVNATQDSSEAEERKSLVMNDFFRRDVFHRGRGRPSGHIEPQHALFQSYVGTPYPFQGLPKEMPVGLQTFNLNSDLHERCMALAESGQHTFSDILQHPKLAAHEREQIWNALLVLLCADLITPINSAAKSGQLSAEQYVAIASPLNRTILTERHLQDGKSYISSPRLGSAVRLNFLQGVFLMALEMGEEATCLQTAESLLYSAPQHWDKAKIPQDDDARLAPDWLPQAWSAFREQWQDFLYRYEFITPRTP